MGRIQKKNLYPYTDLLSCARKNNLCSWNGTIELLTEEGFLPFYESNFKILEYSEIQNETLKKIYEKFLEQEGLTKNDLVEFIDE